MTVMKIELEVDGRVCWPDKLVQLLQCVPGVTVHAAQLNDGLKHVYTTPRVTAAPKGA